MASETPQRTPPTTTPAQGALRRSHCDLCTQLEQIEGALQKSELQRGAYLLNDLIDQMRAHFLQEQSAAQSPGAKSDGEDRLFHDLLIERARRLKTRCLNAPANTDLRHAIEADLVVLMGDLVQSNLCDASNGDDTPDESQ